MKISILPVNVKVNLYKSHFKNSNIAFRCNNSDEFIKTESKPFNSEELLRILNGDFRKLDKEFFDNLSEEEYRFCLDWAKSDEKKFSGMIQYSPKSVLPEDVEGIIKYSDFYYSGLQKIAKQENVPMENLLLAGIGQSPVATVKALELAGLRAAYCPISGLTRFNEPIEKYVTKENIEKYFSQWKKFGFDLNELFSNDLIVFTDHKETGRTIELFKKIIGRIIKLMKEEPENSHKKPAKMKFISLSKIYRNSKKETDEKRWGEEFEESVFHTSYLKTLYSPLFKLPLSNIDEIEERSVLAKNMDRNVRFNKLTVLLYDALYHPQQKTEKKEFSTLDKERKFRLDFYTPEEENKIEIIV